MKLLFIAPIFFDYEKVILNILASRYEKVFFRCEIPFNSAVRYYAVRRLFPSLAKVALRRYNRSLAKLVAEERIERIFIIRGYGLSPDFLEAVRSTNPRIEILNYQWDSIQNNPNGLEISRFADSNYSFDLKDTRQYPQFKHIPLFYSWDALRDLPSPDEFEQDIDLLFLGSYHSRRHEIVQKAKQECQERGLRVYSHIYFPRASFIRNRLTLRTINRKDISFKKISRREYYNLLCRSRAVLDIQSPTQTGATMRTIEALSVGRKLVSTNNMLEQEKFYSPQNVYIWDIAQPLDLKSILNKNSDTHKSKYISDINEWLIMLGL